MTAPYLGPYGLEPDSLQCADCGDRPCPVDHNGMCELCATDPSPEPIDRSIS